MRSRVLFAALGAALLAACEAEQFSAGRFTVEGEWIGRAAVARTTPATADSIRYEILLDLTQEETAIGGSGEIRVDGGETVAVDVVGDWAYPNVDIVIGGEGLVPVRFQGAFDTDSVITLSPPDTTVVVQNDSIVGTLGGSGFNNIRFAIARVTPLP